MGFSVIDSLGNLKVSGISSQGTWTPALKFGGASVGMTYTTQQGAYIKIANLVYITLLITLSAKGSSTGTATITGLPFTCDATFFGGLVWSYFNSITSFDYPMSAAAPGTTTINLLNQFLSNTAVLADTNFTNTSSFIIAGCYIKAP